MPGPVPINAPWALTIARKVEKQKKEMGKIIFLDAGVLVLDANCSRSWKLFLVCGEPADVLYTLREDSGSDLKPISKSDFWTSETCV